MNVKKKQQYINQMERAVLFYQGRADRLWGKKGFRDDANYNLGKAEGMRVAIEILNDENNLWDSD